MTSLPKSTDRQLGLVIDLDICVGCHACAVSCKEWNSNFGAPLSDQDAYGMASGTWLNRIHGYELTRPAVEGAETPAQTVYFPRSCLHCHDAPCVTVCPTGASQKRKSDGIVLVKEDWCMGCGLCAWACPYGARELDMDAGVMKKCTLCVERLDDPNLAPEDREPACVRSCPTRARHFGDLSDPDSAVSRLVEERGGYDLMPEQKTRPANKYLPPRPKRDVGRDVVNLPDKSLNDESGLASDNESADENWQNRFKSWLEKGLQQMGAAG